MFKILFLIIILFIFITVYSFKKKIDGILDSIFPSKNQHRTNKGDLEELVQCDNCGVYIPKSQAVKKIRLKGEDLYFCSPKCKEEYKNKQ